MDQSSIGSLVEKARHFALEGDYISSHTFYEEVKGVIEKGGYHFKSPSYKRTYDSITLEMTEVSSILKDISSLCDTYGYRDIEPLQPAKNTSSVMQPTTSSKSISLNSSLPQSPPSKRLNRLTQQTSSPAILHRHSVDVRGHRLQQPTTSPPKPRMTVPVSRSVQPPTTTDPCMEEETVNQQICDSPADRVSSFAQQYKGSIDLDLVRMLEAEVVDRSPNVTWNSIAGLEKARGILEEAFVLPQWVPEVFQGIRRPWQGILLFGPPGTGKTLLAKAIASECKTTFFNVTSSTLTSKWRGESEKLVRILFEMARFYAPSTVFLDEVDALGGQRGGNGDNDASLRVKAELLVQMDGMGSGIEEGKGSVTVLGATNLPWHLDEALRRRFEKRIYISLPEKHQREQLFRICLQDVMLDSSVQLNHLSDITSGYSGADITNICRDASMMYMRKLIQSLREEGFIGDELQKQLREHVNSVKSFPVTQDDFLSAIKKVSSSVGSADMSRLELWMKEFGSS